MYLFDIPSVPYIRIVEMDTQMKVVSVHVLALTIFFRSIGGGGGCHFKTSCFVDVFESIKRL